MRILQVLKYGIAYENAYGIARLSISLFKLRCIAKKNHRKGYYIKTNIGKKLRLVLIQAKANFCRKNFATKVIIILSIYYLVWPDQVGINIENESTVNSEFI